MLLISLAAAALYLLAGWLAARPANPGAVAAFVVPAALVAHSAALAGQTVDAHALRFGLGEVASLFAWLSALMLWLATLRTPLRSLGALHYPLSALCVLWPAFAANEGKPITEWPVALHVFLSLLGSGFLTLAALHALALFGLERILHRPENLALARRLPPLQTLERLLFLLVFAGFFVLSLTLLSGLLLNDEQRRQPLSMIVLSFGAWLMFGVLIFGRVRYGWRGRTAIRWVLAGYGTLVAAYFGTKLLLEQAL